MSEEKDKTPLRTRTKHFALRIIKVYSALKKSDAAGVIGRQMLRSGTSVGAQYREACRARSNAEFISKLESTCQELEETIYWLELLVESQLVPATRLQLLRDESNELMAMFVASIHTAKQATRRSSSR